MISDELTDEQVKVAGCKRSEDGSLVIVTLECPCCGEDGAYADADDMFEDGQALVCGCDGHVMVDTETEPSINVFDCDCANRERQG